MTAYERGHAGRGNVAPRAAASGELRALELRLARAMVFLVLAWIWLQSSVSLLAQGGEHPLPLTARVVGIACAIAPTLLFLRFRTRLIEGRLRRPEQAAAVAIVTLPLIAASYDAWPPLILCVAIPLLVLTGWARALGAALGVAVAPLIAMASRQEPVTAALVTAFVALVGVCFFVLCRFETVILELRLAHERMARDELDEERDRISRELHDILGRTLVAVSLRTETAMRLIDRDAPGAEDQLRHIRDSVTQAQSSLRQLVRGNTLASLADEVASAAELCGRLGIGMAASVTPVDNAVTDAMLARVVRECTTNLLKHSRATTVRLTTGAADGLAFVEMLNDGVPQGAPARSAAPESPGAPVTPGPGTGLADLRERIVEAGGRWEAGHVEADRFRVVAQVPLTMTPDDAQRADERVRARRHNPTPNGR